MEWKNHTWVHERTRITLLPYFASPWAVCLQKPTKMFRWKEMSVGFECWWVVVNILDEGGSDEVRWSLLTTCCFDVPFKGKAQEHFGSVLIEPFSRPLLEIATYVGQRDCNALEGPWRKHWRGCANTNGAEGETAAAVPAKAAQGKRGAWHSSGAARQHIQVTLLFRHFYSRLHSHNQGICSLVCWVSSF